MSCQRLGRRTIRYFDPPSILASAAVTGKKEAEGPLGGFFDETWDDTTFGQDTWEKAESQIQKIALETALRKAKLKASDLDLLFGGDLLNQCIATTFSIRGTDIPFFGIYGACSTMGEGLCLSSMAVAGGSARIAAAITSSHFASAERQYRLPLEYGGQRTPTAQWTVTGAGAVILGNHVKPPYVAGFTAGRIVDLSVCDANNMGAAMAPAFVDTVCAHFRDTGTGPENYDRIISGDLGTVGSSLASELFEREGYRMDAVQDDCGMLIYDAQRQDVHAGGSGCGCSAAVLCGYLLRQMREGVWNRILFCPTGALLSPVSSQQGESIPSICHAVEITMKRDET